MGCHSGNTSEDYGLIYMTAAERGFACAAGNERRAVGKAVYIADYATCDSHTGARRGLSLIPPLSEKCRAFDVAGVVAVAYLKIDIVAIHIKGTAGFELIIVCGTADDASDCRTRVEAVGVVFSDDGALIATALEQRICRRSSVLNDGADSSDGKFVKIGLGSSGLVHGDVSGVGAVAECADAYL